ncbi:MAG: anacyclamide/piricyclamide family prenylated cyclic peptide [Microcystis panniformis]
MKTLKLTPRITAPVQRDNITTVPSDGNVINPAAFCDLATKQCYPFAGDDAV